MEQFCKNCETELHSSERCVIQDKRVSGNSLLLIGAGAEIMKGKVYAIRLYNRALTDEELLQNYNIDNERYYP